ncbi:hypothetical protein BV25DRAFT_1828412 [Artomyces pyxidatus]|uniref:Uncharacterized protein n=1 Tax=Artomyces pyxidatus TaxID=48021 RepID=A0ACB8SUX8_9AGAM|nr:hypothetical protein BV25DRAFT_1828412 [Artomyces pyxidatus]
MPFEDTIRYSVYRAYGEADWETQFPSGGGVVHLGTDNRTFAVSMFHQLHCLGRIRSAISTNAGASPEVEHCFNYLRQMMLCQADVALEPVVADEFAVGDFLNVHTCKDWSAVYREVEKVVTVDS